MGEVIHYHGGPITPETCAIRAWRAKHAFISHAHPHQIETAAGECQSFALDNGAFSQWKAGKEMDVQGFYAWTAHWRRHPGFDFAVVPDVIAGSEQANDDLAAQWPFARHEGAVVWHINESTDRFARLAREWPRVCIGSSGDYDVSKPKAFMSRMHEVLPAVIDSDGYPVCKLHGLRMLNPVLFSQLPLASADSTNVASNIGKDVNWTGSYKPATKEARAMILVERIEAVNSAGCADDATIARYLLG